MSVAEVLSLTWWGQAGFVLRAPGSDGAVAVDLFLSPHEWRLYDPPSPDSVTDGVAWFLCTHAHGDHLDLPGLAAVAARGPIGVVVPAGVGERARAALPGTEVVELVPGHELEVGAFTATGVAVEHGDEPDDAYREGEFLAYVLRAPGCPTVLHAGDSVPSQRLLETARALHPDVAMLPVNGRDFFRERAGFVGNMSAAEAAHLAAEIGASIVVPMHYDAIRGNTADPGDLVRCVATLGGDLTVLVPARGQTVLVGAG